MSVYSYVGEFPHVGILQLGKEKLYSKIVLALTLKEQKKKWDILAPHLKDKQQHSQQRQRQI